LYPKKKEIIIFRLVPKVLSCFPNGLQKEKRLKEQMKGANCILRKIQRHQHLEDNGSDHELYFFSLVDLKLVLRVLNMSKITTEQLVWCSDKLSKINVVDGKLYVEPCFLLFPCS